MPIPQRIVQQPQVMEEARDPSFVYSGPINDFDPTAEVPNYVGFNYGQQQKDTTDAHFNKLTQQKIYELNRTKESPFSFETGYAY